MVDVAAPVVGARERRKRQVSETIERIAVDLALELGMEGATVEKICERALISHRTFYNYFPSKEAAVFGGGPQPSPQGLEAFRRGTSPDVLGDLLDLMSATALAQEQGPELFRDRQRLLRRDPQLAAKAAPKFDRVVDELNELVRDRLTRMGQDSELHDRAAMIVALALAVVQRAFQMQLEADPDADPRAVLQNSISLARRILTEGQKR